MSGLRKPNGDLPCERRKSLRREITAAKVYRASANQQGPRRFRQRSLANDDHGVSQALHELTGELALVPPTDSTRPPMTTWKPWPWAATSGYARPVRLSEEGEKQVCQTT